MVGMEEGGQEKTTKTSHYPRNIKMEQASISRNSIAKPTHKKRKKKEFQQTLLPWWWLTKGCRVWGSAYHSITSSAKLVAFLSWNASSRYIRWAALRG